MAGIMRKFFDMWSPSEEEEEYNSEIEDIESEKSQTIYEKESPKVLNIRRGKTKISCFKPSEYNREIAEIADNLLAGDIVAINLEIELSHPEIAKRIIDFLRGTVHAVKGRFTRISKNTYVLTPNNVEISGRDLIDELENNDIYI